MFKVGDVVRLRSGGPEMTIIARVDHFVKCAWFDFRSEKLDDSFNEAHLDLVRSETPPEPKPIGRTPGEWSQGTDEWQIVGNGGQVVYVVWGGENRKANRAWALQIPEIERFLRCVVSLEQGATYSIRYAAQAILDAANGKEKP